MAKIGILLTNTGTPDAPTTAAVKNYLREFLSDPRIVHLPRWLWLPLLNGLILPWRAKRSAALYRSIWQQGDSPMRLAMQALASDLQTQLHTHGWDSKVMIGMHYGHPAIADALDELKQHGMQTLIVLPLFPQYSSTTVAASFDRVSHHLKTWHLLPTLHWIGSYADDPHYLAALAKSVEQHWQQQGSKKHLLISFHGLPIRFIKQGDPYQQHCEATAHGLAQRLQLAQGTWTLSYQSQFGYDTWLQPSTQSQLIALATRGVRQLDVICPGFAVDCLETLEEIALRGQETFLQAGGEALHYIPSLNNTSWQLDLLMKKLQPILTTASLAASLNEHKHAHLSY